ncbi:MAG: proline dehydrogenase family protein [Actinomycetes bacterium]
MLRRMLLAAARAQPVAAALRRAPVTRSVVDRFIAGESAAQAVVVARRLRDQGLAVSLDHLGEDVHDAEQAGAARDAYVDLLAGLAEAGVAGGADISVKLSALGAGLGPDGAKVATENAREVCERAVRVGATVTVDMEDHTTTDLTLAVVTDLRVDFPWVGAVLQAYLHRTPGDLAALCTAGSRVRLTKGAYDEPPSVALRERHLVDEAYVRGLRTLMAGPAYPMVATHDPRIIDIAGALAIRYGRTSSTYEYQMLYGIRPDEQRRLARGGEVVRVYVPFGTDWYGYFVRRLAERPGNLVFFARSLVTKG